MTAPPPGRVAMVLTAAVLAVSVAAIFVRLADAPGLVVAWWRMAIAALVLAPLARRGLRRTPLTRATLLPTVAAGVLLGVHFATWISSLSYTSVAASASLVSTTPLWVALAAWAFLRQAPGLGMMLGVLVAVAGGAVIGFGDALGASAGLAVAAPAPLLGDALALVGAIALAGYLMLGRLAQRRGLSIDAYAGVAYAVAALVLAPGPALAGWSYTAYPAATFGWVIALALVPQLIGHTGINFAMRYLNPTRVATATLLEPVGASVLAFLVFAETPSWVTVFGATVLLVGVVLTIRTGRPTAIPAVPGDGV